MIKIIAAVGKNLELGKQDGLIWNLPGDLKFFKEQTINSIVVMGHNTFESLPKKLPNRKHYILTDHPIEKLEFKNDIDGVKIYFNFNCLLEAIIKKARIKDVYIIGGASIYKQFIEYADELILTEIHAEDKAADVYFPSFDKEHYTRQIISSNEDNGIMYDHVRYVKK